MNIFSYLISAFLMFFVGHIQEWLKPTLVDYGAPSWLYNSFAFYAILFVAAGLLNTFIVQLLKPKSEDEKELKRLRTKCKNNEKINEKLNKKSLDECKAEHKKEINRLKKENLASINKIQKDHDEEIKTHKATIRTKDVLIESMTVQLAEKFKVIETYNQETYHNRNTPNTAENNERTRTIIPNIGGYSEI